MRLDISRWDAIDAFVEQLRTDGLDVSADNLKTDGNRQWATCIGRSQKNKKSKSAWYRLNFNYDIPSVIYSNYDKGIIKKVWHLDPKKLSPEECAVNEKEQLRNRIKKYRKERHYKTLQRIAAVWSRIEFKRAKAVNLIDEIPYLKEKLQTDSNLTLFNVRKIDKQPVFAKAIHLMISRAMKKAEAKGKKFDYEKPKYFKNGWFQNYHFRKTLITAYYNQDLKIVNAQLISSFEDKENAGELKHFKANLNHGQKEGAFCPINRLPHVNEKFYAITEGYSTGQSFARISDNRPCVVSAFDKENLMAVGIVLRNISPKANIYFAADNDLETQLKRKENGGVIKAIEASQAVNGNVLIPPITLQQAKIMSDWNDLEIHLGTKQCKKFLLQQLHEIADFKRTEANRINQNNSQFYQPIISPEKTTNVLDPAIFTSWLLENLEKKQRQNTKQGLQDSNLSQATELIKTRASDQKNKVIPMMQYICKKNGWINLNEAINLLSDRLENKVKIESETLNRLNLTIQSMFYAGCNTSQDSTLKVNAESRLKNTIEYINYLPIERHEKLTLYNNLKDKIYNTLEDQEPLWTKELLRICKNLIEAYDLLKSGINRNQSNTNSDYSPPI
ncbi:DNA primase [Acinetobacter sp. Marseille-Q1618]|uniref:DNA primase n=1 Tax=Acinetobacter sp. Marseille-Q1618 TaxID=2697502 RepID=UPI0015714758|nr:DNA primase [Acinetobacter sp. Marseille-Q1618]